MKQFSFALLGAVVLMASGCGGDNRGDNPAPVSSPPPVSGFKAQFIPDFGLAPFPNDLFFVGSEDGTLNIISPIPGVEALNALDGYSTTAPITATFSEPIDASSLVGNQNVFVMEVVTDPLTKATIGFVGFLIEGVDYSVGVSDAVDSGGTILEIVPLKPLKPSASYLVVLTDGIRSVGGQSAVSDTDYETIKGAILVGNVLPDPFLEDIKLFTSAHFAIAGAVGIDTSSIVVTNSFSTQSIGAVLGYLDSTATAQAAAVGPTGLTTMDVNPLLQGKADIWAGTVDVPYYLDATDPLGGFWQGAGGSNLTAFNPVPVATTTLSIPAFLTLPNANSLYVQFGGVKPPTGWPVVIFQHGITQDRTNVFAIADAFADAGVAVIAIDLVLHGITDSTNPFYTPGLERTFDLDLANNVDGTPGPDGMIDGSGAYFINLTSLLTSRDNVRQSVSDLITLTRTLPTIDVDFDQVGDFDASRIYFVGHSLGAIIGTTFLGVNSDVTTATLGMPGGQITDLLLESPAFGPVIIAGLEAAGLQEGTALFNSFIASAQAAVDSGDPINYAASAAAMHPIHMIEVVGGGNVPPDLVVPNSATERLVAEMGLPGVFAPGFNPGSLGVVRYSAGDHGSLLDPTASFAATVEMQTEMVLFAVGNALAGIPGDGAGITISDPTVIAIAP